MTDRLKLIRAGAIAGLPVVTIDGGEDAAEIKDVVYHAAEHHLVGFTLNKRGWFRGSLNAVLLADDVAGIGPDALMVTSEACLSGADTAVGALESPEQDFDVIGNEVVSASGAALGTIVDVIIETGAHPKAVGYEIETAEGTLFVPSSAQMSLSGENMVVQAEAEQFMNDDLAGFGASVLSFRQRLGGAK